MFPIDKKLVQICRVPILTVPPQKLNSTRRRTSAGVEESNLPFTLRKSLIEHGQIADNYCQKREAGCSFCYGYNSVSRSHRHYVAQSQSKKSGPTEIKIVPKVTCLTSFCCFVKERKAKYEHN